MTRFGDPPDSWRKSVLRAVVALVVVVVLGLAVFALIDGSGPDEAGEKAVPASLSCNGAVRLCDRRLNQVVFPGTHNSFAASDEPGWYFANQRYGIGRQLQDGIRALLIDVHFGVYDRATGRVRTDLRAEGSDRNKVAQQVGPRALRLADRIAGRVGIGSLNGAPQPYMCHTLCELGAEPLGQELEVMRRFLDEHPNQVLLVIVEDYVPPATIERSLEETGLRRYVTTLDRHAPLPTLGALIARGQRLVVFAEKDGGSPPWYMPAFSFIQDTPLGARRPSRLMCARFRGEPDSPILLMNHWIDTFPPRPVLNAPIGRADALRRRITRCTRERRKRPGIVAVDFYEQTELVKVAHRLNAEPAEPR